MDEIIRWRMTGDSSNSTPGNDAAVALLQLDEWLAANALMPPATPHRTPRIKDLGAEVAALLCNYRPNSPGWKSLNNTLRELYFAGLVLGALGPNSYADALGSLAVNSHQQR